MRIVSFIKHIAWACLLTLGLSGCATLLDRLPAQAPPMTLSEEKTVGAIALPVAVQRLGGRYADPVLAGYVARLGDALARQTGRAGIDYRFVIVDRTRPGLYALPAGKILVTRGLLAQLQDASAYAAVLEHAIIRSTDPPFAGPATHGMVTAAQQMTSRKEPDNQWELDAPADRFVRAILKRDERHMLDLGVIRGTQTPLDRPLRFTAREKEAVTRLQELQPGYRLLDQARELETTGAQQAAIATYLAAAAEAPDQAEILRELGQSFLRANDLHSARLHLEKAFSVQPDNYRTRMGLGYIALQRGDLGGAMEQLRASVRLLPVAENFYLLGRVYQQQGRSDKAARFYRAIVEAEPRSKLGRAARERLSALENAS